MEIVNELTGESQTPEELFSQLRTIERSITRLDDAIARYNAERKAAKDARDKAVAEMRSIVREIRVLERQAKRRGGNNKQGKN